MDDVLISAKFGFDDSVRLEATLAGDKTFFHDTVELEAAGLYLEIDTKVGIEVGLDVHIAVNLKQQSCNWQPPHDCTSKLHFFGELGVAVDALEVEVAMQDPWYEPLGIPHIAILDTDIDVAISYELIPQKIGLAGGLELGKIKAEAAFYFAETGELMVHGELDNFNLGDVVESLFDDIGLNSVGNFMHTILNIGCRKIELTINPGPTAITFNQETYRVGFKFEVEDFNMWNIIKGSALIQIQPHSGLIIRVSLQPISLLGGLIELRGCLRMPPNRPNFEKAAFEGEDLSLTGPNKSAGDPLIFDLELTLQKHYLHISATIKLFGAELDVLADIDDNGFYFEIDMSLLGDMLKFNLTAASIGPSGHPSDFIVSAKAHQGLLDYIGVEIPKKIEALKKKINGGLDDANSWLEKKKQGLQSLEDKAAAIKKADAAKLAPAERKLHDAANSLSRAESKVNGLQSSINSAEHKLHSCHWYEFLWCQDRYGAEIAGLYIAKGVADAALEVAKGVVNLANDGLHSFPPSTPASLHSTRRMASPRPLSMPPKSPLRRQS